MKGTSVSQPNIQTSRHPNIQTSRRLPTPFHSIPGESKQVRTRSEERVQTDKTIQSRLLWTVRPSDHPVRSHFAFLYSISFHIVDTRYWIHITHTTTLLYHRHPFRPFQSRISFFLLVLVLFIPSLVFAYVLCILYTVLYIHLTFTITIKPKGTVLSARGSTVHSTVSNSLHQIANSEIKVTDQENVKLNM